MRDFLLGVLFGFFLFITCSQVRDFIDRLDLDLPEINIEWSWDKEEEVTVPENVNGVIDELSDIAVYYGDEDDCDDVVEYVEELLPNDIEMIIAESTRMEIIGGSREDFRDHMEGTEIDKDVNDSYVGITGYGYESKSILYSMADVKVLLHELGHAYEYSFWYNKEDCPSETDQWKFSFEHEFTTAYGETDTYEFFAEAFSMYFLEPDELKASAPIAYELLNNEFGCY